MKKVNIQVVETMIAILSEFNNFCLFKINLIVKIIVAGIVKKEMIAGIIAMKPNQSIDKLDGSGSCP